MRKYKIIEEMTENGDCKYTIWWHEPFLWMKDRWVPERHYVGAKIYKTTKFNTLEETIAYLVDRYGTRSKRVVSEGMI